MKASARHVLEPVPYRVHRFKKETRDTFTFQLISTKGKSVPRFRPGQFNMLYLYGVGEVPISISGDPRDEGKIVHTVRAYGAVTSRMMNLKGGELLGVRGPFGRAWPVEKLMGRDVGACGGAVSVSHPCGPSFSTSFPIGAIMGT